MTCSTHRPTSLRALYNRGPRTWLACDAIRGAAHIQYSMCLGATPNVSPSYSRSPWARSTGANILVRSLYLRQVGCVFGTCLPNPALSLIKAFRCAVLDILFRILATPNVALKFLHNLPKKFKFLIPGKCAVSTVQFQSIRISFLLDLRLPSRFGQLCRVWAFSPCYQPGTWSDSQFRILTSVQSIDYLGRATMIFRHHLPNPHRRLLHC